jgi:hypothetical protein
MSRSRRAEPVALIPLLRFRAVVRHFLGYRFSDEEVRSIRTVLARAPRIQGRLLADAFVEQIAGEPHLAEVWYADEDGDPLITVLTRTFDDALEMRLHEAFERLVDSFGEPRLGRLAIHALDEPHPAPPGLRLFTSPTASHATA